MGFDGNKRIKGCKRHTLVDTLGLLLAVVVTAANVDDRQGLVEVLERYLARGGRRLRKIWVDQGYETQWLKGSRSNRTAGKWNARFRGFAMIVVTVGIMKH